MNIFGLSLEEISSENPPREDLDILPGIPAALSPEDAAYILAVSIQTIERMLEGGDLPKDRSGDIPKAALVSYIKSHALADRPVLEDEKTPPKT
jgi:hypothetical protein